MNRFLSFFILINVICFNQANAQLTVDNNTPNDNPVLLIDDILLGGGVIASNHSYMGDSIQIGYFDGSNSNLGLSSGIVLSTGDISILDPDFVDFSSKKLSEGLPQISEHHKSSNSQSKSAIFL